MQQNKHSYEKTTHMLKPIFGILLFVNLIFGVNGTKATAQVNSENKSNPFTVNVNYTGDIFGNVSGGIERGVGYMDNFDVNLEINFDQLPLGLDGTTIYMYGLGNQGKGISQYVGDLQGTSNIEAENSWRIFELWAQKKFFLTNSSMLVGLYDINSEFNFLNSSLLFLNSSHGLDPTIASSGIMGPSTFPYTSMAARLKISPLGGWVLQAAVLDGVPSNPENSRGTKILFRESDGIFGIAEIGYHTADNQQMEMRSRTARLQNLLAPGVEANDKIAVGGWFYSVERDELDGTGKDLEYGFYAIGEYEVCHEEIAPDDVCSIKVFGRAGFANPSVSMLGAYFGAGVTFLGIIPGRNSDQTGVAISRAEAGSAYRHNRLIDGLEPSEAETNLELTHQFVLNDYASIQADFQYIFNPGLNPALENALVVGTRITVGF